MPRLFLGAVHMFQHRCDLVVELTELMQQVAVGLAREPRAHSAPPQSVAWSKISMTVSMGSAVH